MLTDAGRKALRAWLAEPTPFPRLQSEANVRLLAGALVTDATLAGSLLGMRTELDELSGLLDESERRLADLPGRERYLRLSYDLGRRLVAAHSEWLEEVERELG